MKREAPKHFITLLFYRSDRCRTYLSLNALEQDIASLTATVSQHMPRIVSPMTLEMNAPSSQNPSTPDDVNSLVQAINGSAVGQIVPRSGCQFTRLTYFVSAAQKVVATSRLTKTDTNRPPQTALPSTHEPKGMLGGFCASVGLRGTSDLPPQKIPLVSLVTLVKDADFYK